MPWEPGQAPRAGGFEAWIDEVFSSLSRYLLNIETMKMEIREKPPFKPRNGLYYADGTTWNPGSGRGVYRFDESTGTYAFLG